jgi:hypothetical protein
VSDIPTYLDQRLPSIAEEALKAAKIAVNQIRSVAAGNNQLGNSRLWLQYDPPIQREFENALNTAARLISEIAGSAASEYAGHLEKLASGLIEQIIQWREEGRGKGRYNDNNGLNAHIDRVRVALTRAKDNIIGDFRFGVVEGRQMASNPVQNVLTIQNVRDSIINVVQTGHLSGKYEDVARQLADILKSAEVEHLPTEAKEEVAALADIVKDELSKAPSPNQGKVLRGITLLGNALRRLGANTASATIAKLIADYLTSG